MTNSLADFTRLRLEVMKDGKGEWGKKKLISKRRSERVNKSVRNRK